jgi:hypothetical protein
MAGIVNFRDANLQNEESQALWSPANMDGAGWAVATGGSKAQGGQTDKSTSSGVGGITLMVGAVAALGLVLFLRRRKG